MLNLCKPYKPYKQWRKEHEKTKKGGTVVEVKRRKLDEAARLKTNGSPMETGKGQETSNGNLQKKLKETNIQETRQIQVFESTDMWE